MRRPTHLLTILALLALAHAPITRAAEPKRPEVWMSPPGQDACRAFRELFEQPDAWKETRSLIDVLFITDLNMKRHFGDEELTRWFHQMQSWKLKFGMEVGAIKPWGLTGQKTFDVEKPIWDRLIRLGAKIDAVAMDEPLLCCREHVKKSDEYALQETANYIALVRKHYPDTRIGDIETYPSIPVADHAKWLDALQKRLAEMGVRGLDFYRLDVNWVNFLVQVKGNWPEVRQIEQLCRTRKIPFSLIYWASGQPLLQRLGTADESTWYTSIMHQADAYTMIQGRPDQMVLESWIGQPPHCLPESAEWTFTRSVRDFCRRYVKGTR